jgi:Na+/proline symporter
VPSDLIIIAIYLLLMFTAGIFFSRNIKSTADYFLAARSAPWFWIMGAVWATNIGFLHGYLAHGGAAYEWGLIQANFEWFQGPFAYILTSLSHSIGVPGYLQCRIFWKEGMARR